MLRRIGRVLRRLAIGLAVFAALVAAAAFGVSVAWNDARIARSVSDWVSHTLRGHGGPAGQALTIGRIHYRWTPALRSILLGGTCPFEAWDVGIYDPEGREVIAAPHVTGRIRLGHLVWRQLTSVVLPHDLELHFEDVHVETARVRIAELADGKVNIVEAFSSKEPHPQPPGSGMVISVRGAHVDDVGFSMAFPGWHAEAGHAVVALDALRYSSFLDEEEQYKPAFTFRVGSLKAAHGNLTLGDAWVFPLDDLDVDQFEAREPERQHLAFAGQTRSRGARATIAGRLLDVYSPTPGVDATLRFTDGAELLGMLPTGELLGGDPAGEVRFHGPFSHVVLDGGLRGAEFHAASLVAREVAAGFQLDGALLKLDGITASLGRGRLSGGLDVDFNEMAWKAHLRVAGMDPAALTPLVPPAAGRLLAGSFDGGAALDGSLITHPERIHVRAIDARLRRRVHDRLPGTVELRGQLEVRPDRVLFQGLRVAAGGLAGTLRGEVNFVTGTIGTQLAVEGRKLGPLLARLGLPDVLSALSATTRVSGRLLEPTIEGHVSARDVGSGERRLPHVEAELHFAHGQLQATALHGAGFDGLVDGEATLGLFDGPLTRPLAEPTLGLELRADHIDVRQLIGLPALVGTASGKLRLDGTLAHPNGEVSVTIPTLGVYGDPYRNGLLTATVGDPGIEIAAISLEREQGGRFTGRGHVGWDGSLDVDLQPKDFPLQAIPPLRDTPVTLGGLLSGAVHLGGTLARWVPSGIIAATAVRVRDLLFGDGRLELEPDGDVVRLSGVFFQRFRVDGWMRLQPSVAGDVTIGFEDQPLEELIPELSKLAEVKSLASGTARIAFDAGLDRADVELRLSRLLITFTSDDDRAHNYGAGGDLGAAPDGDASGSGNDALAQGDASLLGSERAGDGYRDQFVNEGDLVFRTDGHSFRFDQFHLYSQRPVRGQLLRVGELDVRGALAPEGSDLTVRGHLALRFLEYFTARWFAHTHGRATANVRILGPMMHPKLLGTLDLERAWITPRGADRPLHVPSGRLSFTERGVQLDGLKLEMDGAQAGAQAQLAVDWRDWSLGTVSLRLDGEVSSAVLAWMLPEHVSEPQGRFGVHLSVDGRYPTLSWSGDVTARDVAFHEKKLGRDVRLLSGTVLFRGYDLLVGCADGSARTDVSTPIDCQRLHARVDDSDLQINGVVTWQGSPLSPRLRAVELRLTGENLEWGTPGIYSLTLSPDLRLSGDAARLRLVGAVNVVTGRYAQNFDVVKGLLIQPRTVENDPPFYDGIPLLENMLLDLRVGSLGALFIRNNLADLTVTLPSLAVGGTLAHPTLDGTIFVDAGGRFTVPLLRTEFITEAGAITFERQKDFPTRTPRLDIRASTDWQDRYEQIHHINLSVLGTYHEPNIDLSSTEGWDKNQVLFALATGGTPDQLRRTLGDPTRTAASGSATDGVTKSLVGSLFLHNIEDPLKQAIHLDLFRLELGYDSVSVKLCPVNQPAYRLCGTGDWGFVSSTRYDATGELQLSDHFSVIGSLERKEHGIDTAEDVITRGRLQLTLKLPLF